MVSCRIASSTSLCAKSRGIRLLGFRLSRRLGRGRLRRLVDSRILGRGRGVVSIVREQHRCIGHCKLNGIREQHGFRQGQHGIDREQWYLMGYNHDIRDYGIFSRDGFPLRLLARYLLEPRPAIAHRTNDMRSRIAAASKLPRTGD